MAGVLTLQLDVVIPRIVEIGLLRQPKEACGLIVPDLKKPPREWVVELENKSPAPYESYAIDPRTADQLLEEDTIWSDVVVWHTHPSGNVGPSRGDLEARLEGLTYLVVALPNGEPVVF